MLDTVISLKYMFAGYTIILSVLAIYLISLVVRWKNLHRDLKTLNEIDKKI
jgi:hypothetical protein